MSESNDSGVQSDTQSITDEDYGELCGYAQQVDHNTVIPSKFAKIEHLIALGKTLQGIFHDLASMPIGNNQKKILIPSTL